MTTEALDGFVTTGSGTGRDGSAGRAGVGGDTSDDFIGGDNGPLQPLTNTTAAIVRVHREVVGCIARSP
jgi:hypothetical protein